MPVHSQISLPLRGYQTSSQSLQSGNQFRNPCAHIIEAMLRNVAGDDVALSLNPQLHVQQHSYSDHINSYSLNQGEQDDEDDEDEEEHDPYEEQQQPKKRKMVPVDGDELVCPVCHEHIQGSKSKYYKHIHQEHPEHYGDKNKKQKKYAGGQHDCPVCKVEIDGSLSKYYKHIHDVRRCRSAVLLAFLQLLIILSLLS